MSERLSTNEGSGSIDAGSSHKQRADAIAEAVRSDVLAGRFRPGEWLRQERIAQQHDASQMPVREALRRLVAEGILEHVPYRGVRVVQFTAADVEDLYLCQLFIEGLAARHAAVFIEHTQLRELDRLHGAMLACAIDRDLRHYQEIHRAFHELIAQASHRGLLVRMLGQLSAAWRTLPCSNLANAVTAWTPHHPGTDEQEHAAIIRALAARDAEAAENAVRQHIQAVGSRVVSGPSRE